MLMAADMSARSLGCLAILTDAGPVAALPTGFFLMAIGQTMAKKTMLALLPTFYRYVPSNWRLHNVVESASSQH